MPDGNVLPEGLERKLEAIMCDLDFDRGADAEIRLDPEGGGAHLWIRHSAKARSRWQQAVRIAPQWIQAAEAWLGDFYDYPCPHCGAPRYDRHVPLCTRCGYE